MAIGTGKVAFKQTMRAFIFDHQRQVRAHQGRIGLHLRLRGSLRTNENGERVGLHGLDENGAVDDLIEFRRVHCNSY